MIRQIARSLPTFLLLSWLFAANGAAPPRNQKGHACLAVESLGAQTLRSDPRKKGRAGQRGLPGGNVRLRWSASISRKAVVGPRRRRTLGSLSPDGLTWTFHVRPGQTFHNGDRKLTRPRREIRLERQMGSGLAGRPPPRAMRRTIKSIEVVD